MIKSKQALFSIKTFFLIILAFQLCQIGFFKRAFFLERYDVDYWKDRYEHSQYQLPLSKRIIGDDGLYAYAGYRLAKGDDPFSINVDKPPTVKYIIGSSILLFKNPLYASLLFGLLGLLVFYLLAQFLLKDTFLALFVTSILFLDPLFFSQLWISSLDIFYLFFLLTNIFLLISSLGLRKYSAVVILVSGLALGLFIETKPPILAPIIFLMETIYLLLRFGKREYLLFIAGVVAGIFLPYLRYMQLGHGLLDVLRVHRYMLSIYQQSKLPIHIGAILQTLLFGEFPHVTKSTLLRVSEWWIAWPLISVIGFLSVFLSLVKRNSGELVWRGLSIFLFSTIIIYSFIPSYPRYLIIILPFLYLFSIYLLKDFLKKKLLRIFLGAVLIYGLVNSLFFLQPSINSLLSVFYYNFSNQYFHDIYQENLDKQSRSLISREDFRSIAQKTLIDASVRAIDIREREKSLPFLFGDKAKIKIIVTYKTQDLGVFYEGKTLNLLKEDGAWKVQWDWGLLLNNFKHGYKIEVKTVQGRRGRIIGKRGVSVQDEMSYMIVVNPEKIDLKREEEMLRLIGKIGNQSWLNLQNAYLENVLANTYVPLVTIYQPINSKLKEKLLSYRGVKLISHYSRIYYYGSEPKDIKNTSFKECCTKLYSSYNYHGVAGLEKIYDQILAGYSGGRIAMKDGENQLVRVLLEKEARNGSDVYLSD